MTSPLTDLRQVFAGGIQAQDASIQDEWKKEAAAAGQRKETYKINFLLEEFKGQLRDPGTDLIYEHAFVPSWYETTKVLYDLRRWINECTAGVYFIYDSENVLQYVGMSCGGTLGDRIHHMTHRQYARAVDVALFESHWPHFALAFEALAISRLKPPKNIENRGFMRMRIEPLPPYESKWPDPGSVDA